jgi:hypothetical protein
MDKWLPAIKLTGIGFYIAVCIAGGAYLGWWLGDKRSVWIILGLVIGLVIAVFGVFRMLKPLIKDINRKEKD